MISVREGISRFDFTPIVFELPSIHARSSCGTTYPSTTAPLAAPGAGLLAGTIGIRVPGAMLSNFMLVRLQDGGAGPKRRGQSSASVTSSSLRTVCGRGAGSLVTRRTGGRILMAALDTNEH